MEQRTFKASSVRTVQGEVRAASRRGENGRPRRVEDTSVDPEPAQVVRHRQAGPDHHCVVRVYGGATADRYRVCRPPDRPDRQRPRSAAERGLFIQPGELVRVADRVDAGDLAVRDH